MVMYNQYKKLFKILFQGQMINDEYIDRVLHGELNWKENEAILRFTLVLIVECT